MTQLASDDFNRADNTDLGANWTVGTGSQSFKIVSNQVKPSDLIQDCVEFYNGVVWPNDQYSQVEIAEVSSAGSEAGIGAVVRHSGAARTLYWCVVGDAGSNNVSLAKFVAGTYTNLALRTQAFSANDIIYLGVEGTTLTMKRNGSQLGATVSDSSVSTGSAGLGYSSTASSATIDNWSGGDFTVPPAPVVGVKMGSMLGKGAITLDRAFILGTN